MIKLDNVSEQVELKPCPFCGCAAVVREMVHEALWVVECSDPNQDNHYAQSFGATKKEAIENWNKRADNV